MTTTKKGYALAAKLSPAIGYTEQIAETCSRICRTAATLHRLNEETCNGPWWMDNSDQNIGRLYRDQGDSETFRAARNRHSERMTQWESDLDAKHDSALRRLDSLVRDLPETDAGPWKLDAETDPRGCSVIIAPADGIVSGDSWGDRNGVCVP